MSATADALVARATKRQLRAADPDISAWVSASAGSGKTKVLIDRCVRLLLAGAPPEQILCLTYTRAAAAEMAGRIMKRLSGWAVCGEDELARNLTELTGAAATAAMTARARGLFTRILDCPGGLRIKTFHAFAQEILARFPIEAGVSPHFTPLEEHEAAQMRDEALEHILGADNVTQDWNLLIGAAGVESIAHMLQVFLRAPHKFPAAIDRHGDWDRLRAALCRNAQVPHDRSAEEFLASACADRNLPLGDLQQAVWLYRQGKMTATAAKSAARLADWLARPVTDRARTFDDYQAFFLTSKGETRKYILGAALAKQHSALEEAMQSAAESVARIALQYQSLRRIGVTMALLRLGQNLRREYQQRKQRAAALDFDDIIAKTAALLQRPGIAPWVLWKLDGGISHIMIDEAQDTSTQQWQIIQSLTEEFFAGQGAREQQRTLFVVGDEKQSIYSFQHADPALFLAMRAWFAERARQAGIVFEEITLDVSFRSAPKILQAVDAVFYRDAAHQGVSAAPVVHFAKRQDAQGYVELWPPIQPLKSEDDEDSGGGDWEPRREYRPAEAPHAQLAAQIAARIDDWCRHGQSNGGNRRKVSPGDILILVRRRNEFVPALVRELKERGVPVSGVDRMQLGAQIGVLDLLAVMQFALLPEDDLNLACVLRGPLLGMDETTLENLCHARPGSLWEAVRAAPELRACRAWLEWAWGLAGRMTPYAFLTQILSQPCPAARSGRMAMIARLGSDAIDPIDELLNRAQEFARRHPPALQNFLFAMRRDTAEIKRELDQGAGQVRIMTVHAAKGLQAPIVILPDSCALPRTQDLDDLQWDAATQLPYYTGGGSETRDALAKRLRAEAHEAALEEYRRLLYVALTRAADQLYIFGYQGKKGGNGEHWHQLIRATLCPEIGEAPPGQPLIALIDPPGVEPPQAQTQQASVPHPPPLPAWINETAPPEAAPRRLSPSRLGGDESAAVSPAQGESRNQAQRGKILHRMLQYLPDFPAAERTQAAERFLALHWSDIAPEQRATYTEEIMRIIGHPDHAALFGPDSRAEAGIAGKIGGIDMSGQIDRLVIDAHQIMIVDYKTNRPPPESIAAIPASYRRQMAAYRALLQQIEPGKEVRCFLLWTYTGVMMELPESDLGHLDLAAA